MNTSLGRFLVVPVAWWGIWVTRVPLWYFMVASIPGRVSLVPGISLWFLGVSLIPIVSPWDVCLWLIRECDPLGYVRGYKSLGRVRWHGRAGGSGGREPGSRAVRAREILRRIRGYGIQRGSCVLQRRVGEPSVTPVDVPVVVPVLGPLVVPVEVPHHLPADALVPVRISFVTPAVGGILEVRVLIPA